MPGPELGARKYLQFWPIAVAFTIMIGGDAVQAYQVGELQEKVKTIEGIQIQQAITETNITHIQSDLEDLNDDVKDVNEKLDLILQEIKK